MGDLTSLHLSLPLIAPSQAQKHVTHNEAILRLDACVDISLRQRGRNDPPEVPAECDRFCLGDSPTGDWSGHAGEIAFFLDGAWEFLALRTGLRAWLADEQCLSVWDGAAWQDIRPAGTAETVALLGVNAQADSTSRLAVKSDRVTFSHDDITPGSGDMRLVLNRAMPGAEASLQLGTGGQAEAALGLFADEGLALKVTVDGEGPRPAMAVDPRTA